MPIPTHCARIDCHLGVIAAALLVTCTSGCTVLQRWGNALFVHVEESHDLARIRHDAIQELSDQVIEERRLAAQREVELARYEAERRQMERDFCLANEQALQERLRSNVRQKLESKVAFNVTQGLEVGELEVDTEKLKELLTEREKQPPTSPIQEKPKCCPCCDQPCICGSGFLRRFCPHCCQKPCEAEKSCGGPEALNELEKQPFRQPLRPAEIPLKLPVYLTFGMQQPLVESARIRQQPVLPPRENVRQPCPYPCTEPSGMPCVTPVNPGPLPAGSDSPPLPTGWPRFQPKAEPNPSAPVPIADPTEQARQQRRGVRVRLVPTSSDNQIVPPLVEPARSAAY